jgi:hypothetical protein
MKPEAIPCVYWYKKSGAPDIRSSVWWQDILAVFHSHDFVTSGNSCSGIRQTRPAASSIATGFRVQQVTTLSVHRLIITIDTIVHLRFNDICISFGFSPTCSRNPCMVGDGLDMNIESLWLQSIETVNLFHCSLSLDRHRLQQEFESMLTGLIWFIIRTKNRILWRRSWTFEFHESYGFLLTGWASVSFSRRTLVNVDSCHLKRKLRIQDVFGIKICSCNVMHD